MTATMAAGLATSCEEKDNTEPEKEPEEEVEIPLEDATYILNTNSDVFHSLMCSRAPDPDSENYKLTDKSREALIEGGYDPCGICKP